jgi:hypothetical protein
MVAKLPDLFDAIYLPNDRRNTNALVHISEHELISLFSYNLYNPHKMGISSIIILKAN